MEFAICEDGLIRKPDVNEIQRYMDWCEKSVQDARDRVNEYNKEDEIKRLHDELDAVRNNSLQVFSNVEQERAEKFRREHYEKCGHRTSFWYNLDGTGIGTIVKIKCDKCGEVLDITDVDCW